MPDKPMTKPWSEGLQDNGFIPETYLTMLGRDVLVNLLTGAKRALHDSSMTRYTPATEVELDELLQRFLGYERQ